MDDVSLRLLDLVRPGLVDQTTPRWQQRKSAATRVHILESTIDCLVESGYAGLSTALVATVADVSRGAMHHHFPTKMALVAAVIEYTFYRRMKFFLDDFARSLKPGSDRLALATEVHWRSVNTREYAAFLELAVAARTDRDLNRYFLPAARKFDRVWWNEMTAAFPFWRKIRGRVKLASDFAIAAHMGLLLNEPVLGKTGRGKALKKLISSVIKKLHTGTLP